MGGDDDGFADLEGGLEDAALDDGEFLHRTFDAEIAAGDHDGVGLLDDLVDKLHGALILDLGDDLGLAVVPLQDLAQGNDIGGFAAEGEGDEVDARLGSNGDVGQILLGERRKVHLHAGQIDVAAGAEFAGCEDLAADAAVLFGKHLQVNDAVINKDDIALRDVVDEAIIIDVHRVELLTADAAHRELHDVAHLEVELHGEIPSADGRPLGIHQNTDGEGELVGDFADGGDDLADPVVVGVAHVEPEDVRAGQHHLTEPLG